MTAWNCERRRQVAKILSNGFQTVQVSNARKIPLTVPISLKVPAEKRNSLKFFGATVIELEDDL